MRKTAAFTALVLSNSVACVATEAMPSDSIQGGSSNSAGGMSGASQPVISGGATPAGSSGAAGMTTSGAPSIPAGGSSDRAGAAGNTAQGGAGGNSGTGGASGDSAQTCAENKLPDGLQGNEAVCLAPDVPCDNQGSQPRIDRHNSYVQIAKQGNVDLLLLGDFLCDDFRGDSGPFKATKLVYDSAFGGYRPADFCEGGDMTEHLLWRIQNGELDGIHPKVVMLNVGTTNGGRNDKPERILAGIKAIIDYTLQKIPGVKILLVPVLPWGSGDVNARHTSVNKYMSLLDDCGKTVRFVDIYPKFLRPDGSLPEPGEITRDGGVHLNAIGYQIWADAIKTPLAEMMR